MCGVFVAIVVGGVFLLLTTSAVDLSLSLGDDFVVRQLFFCVGGIVRSRLGSCRF